VRYLAGLDDMASHLTTHVPMQILTDIDNGRNPMHLTKDRLERAATENQFMNGKIQAIEVRYQSDNDFIGTLMRIHL
jgi:mediator of RNA polymerase II transcription subunit 10